MPEALIRWRDGAASVEADDWTLLAAGAAWPETGRLIVPLADALGNPVAVDRRAQIGLLLAADDDPHAAVPLFAHVALIAVQFPKFTDGRGYSTATLLRTRLGWRGELRAVGDVLHDQLLLLARVGFDSFALRAGRDPQAALRAFDAFTDSYQAAAFPHQPWFRRRIQEHA
jgi:uncharacterized protein (DUF934 family)